MSLNRNADALIITLDNFIQFKKQKSSPLFLFSFFTNADQIIFDIPL